MRWLGAGGMGTVELVHDGVRGEQIARKRILHARPDALLHFKREFRTVDGLRHPGLAALYELGEDGDGPYFTMEHVDGVSVLEFCSVRTSALRAAVSATRPIEAVERDKITRTAPVSVGVGAATTVIDRARPIAPAACDWDRLEHVVPQLVDALVFLHDSGLAHCDLKPSNALVRSDGVLKLLDFGLIADLQAQRGVEESVSGTLPYMAPERLQGGTASAAVDAYALGVILFELVTGQCPFGGSAHAVIHAHLHVTPPRLDSLVSDAPPLWTELCAALLRKRPEDRPTLQEVSLRLAPQRTPSLARPAANHELVGRDALKARLRGRWRAVVAGGSDYVLLTGPTGAGKTALAAWLAGEARGERALVLTGRARPSERLAFNVADGAIDDLAKHLRHSPLEGMTDDRARAASLFPVLQAEDVGPASVSRAGAFVSLASLLAREGARQPVLVWLDDLQWADADSLALLDSLLERAPSRVMLVMTSRFDVDENRATAWVRAHAADHEAPVTPLDDDDVLRIVARSGGIGTDAGTVRGLLDAVRGLPGLAELAGRVQAGTGSSGSLYGALAANIERQGPVALSALALILAAESWLSIDRLAAMMGETTGVVEEAIVAMERDSIVRRSPERTVDLYHDTVRSTALATLDDRSMRDAHAKLAAWYRSAPRAELFRLVRHLRGAGDLAEAARLAADAARAAEEHRAYGAAADMYALALTGAGPDERRPLLHGRARALERIGAYADAGACWRELRSTTPTEDEALDAALREAECLLASGAVAEGYERLDEAFVASGRPSVRHRSWMEAAQLVLGPLRVTTPRRGKVDMARAERELAAATIVANFDPIAGATILMRARRAFLREGASELVALCEMTCALVAYCSAARGVRAPLGDRWWSAARSRLAGGTDVPELVALEGALDATLGLRGGDWASAERAAEAGVAVMERARYAGSHSHLFLLVGRCELELWRQDVVAHTAQYQRLRGAARDAGAGPVEFQVATNRLLLLALSGDLETATTRSRELRAEWPSTPLTSQRVYMEMHAAFIDALRGDPKAAWESSRRMLDFTRAMGGTAIHASMFLGVAARAELLAWAAGIPGASRGRAVRAARRAKGMPPVFGGLAGRTLAYAYEVDGRIDRAVAELEACEREAARLGQRIDGALAQWQRGRLLGGDAGAQLCAAARQLLVAAGSSARLFGEWPISRP